VSETSIDGDQNLQIITQDEEKCLARIQGHLGERKVSAQGAKKINYDKELISLRDQISQARTEDVPPLLEQMERVQALAARQSQKKEEFVDPRSPYFGRMVLEEEGRQREVLIGRGTYLDATRGVRIVDWRDAPVSRLFYRYAEGDDYDEEFGGKEVYGVVKTRRSLTIAEKELKRISSPQGSFLRSKKHGWVQLDDSSMKLAGGQGSASRAVKPRGKLGVGDAITENEDKHLKEITPLIDQRQFELITRPDSGLVIIQGGAGSGKTTIGLHRLAYLAYHDKRRFRPEKMLVVVFNEALVRYISHVLPSLGLKGVVTRTYQDWAARLRASALPYLPRIYSDDTPISVTRVKKHPIMLQVLESQVTEAAKKISSQLREFAQADPNLEPGIVTFERSAERPLLHRMHGLLAWINDHEEAILVEPRHQAIRFVKRQLENFKDVSHLWAEMLTDLSLLKKAFKDCAPGTLLSGDIERVHSYCSKHCSAAIHHAEERMEGASEDDAEDAPQAVDGLQLEERATLDREDDTLLLRLLQLVRGPLRKGQSGKEALIYEHVLVDEAQDLSPVEMAVIFGTVSKGQSVTLAGDTAQRLHMDNGFSDWKTVIAELGLSHVEVEPLKLSYRSTAEILEVAAHVLGPLAPEDPPLATRHGAPVELFVRGEMGESVAFLAEALRSLAINEPRASIAVVARYPEQADLYYRGLQRGEVPYLRRIDDQNFPFKPGVDVTDIRQVKGLEFDYVILVEVTESAYPQEIDARHLLHIGATRAAHQLWIMASGKPSLLLPEALRDRGY